MIDSNILFHEVLIDPEYTVDSSGGYGFDTNEAVDSKAFKPSVNNTQEYPYGSWDLGYGVLPNAGAWDLQLFHILRKGNSFGFRLKDWQNYQISTAQYFARGIVLTTVVEAVTKVITVSGDYTLTFVVGLQFKITGSVNDGLTFTVVSSTYDSSGDFTDITVSETVLSDANGGNALSVLNYQLGQLFLGETISGTDIAASTTQLTSATTNKFQDVIVGSKIFVQGFNATYKKNNGIFRVTAKPNNQTLTVHPLEFDGTAANTALTTRSAGDSVVIRMDVILKPLYKIMDGDFLDSSVGEPVVNQSASALTVSTDYAINERDGMVTVTLNTTLANYDPFTWTGGFHIPVRFLDARLNLDYSSALNKDLPNAGVQEMNMTR